MGAPTFDLDYEIFTNLRSKDDWLITETVGSDTEASQRFISEAISSAWREFRRYKGKSRLARIFHEPEVSFFYGLSNGITGPQEWKVGVV